MLLSVLAVLCLYIRGEVYSVSLSNLDDYSSYYQQQIRSLSTPPKTRKAFIDRTFYQQASAIPNEDLVSVSFNGEDDNYASSSFAHGSQSTHDPIYMNELSSNDDIELHTNNHQSLNGGSVSNPTATGSHKSRHNYNAYPTEHTNLFKLSQTSNVNLNYLHNLLSSKPLSSNQFASLLNFNLNGLASSLHNPAPPNNNYITSYYSTLVQPDQPQPTTPSPPVPIDYSGSFESCGRQQISAREPRIVGGNSTYEGEFPWAVNIQRQGNHHCGGVIVGHRWILTAAHCVRNQLISNLVVRTGAHSFSKSINHITSHLSRDYLVDQIVMHDDFSRYDNLTSSQVKLSANTNNADIALVKLKNDIVWNELAWPVCFPQRESGNFSGHDAVVVGWGKLSEKSDDFSNDLQKVKVTIIDNNVCQSWFKQAGRDIPIDDRIICAGFKKGGKDACHGDSGGPLLSKIGGRYVVVGIVSTGIGCARPLLPGLYSRVTSYISWIERHVN